MKSIPIRMKLIGGFLALLMIVCAGLGFIAYDRAMRASLGQMQDITGDIRSGGEQVQASAEEMSRLAEQLKGLVGQFEI